MPKPIINEADCTGCGICADACPQSVLEIADGISTVVAADDCIGCSVCMNECPVGAITEIED